MFTKKDIEELIELADDMLLYVPEYFRGKYHYEEDLSKFKNKLKNLGEGEAGTGYALLSDGWRDGKTEKPDDREEIILCLNPDDCIIGMYRNEIESVIERHTDDKYNINYYKWKRLTAPSF